MRSPQPRMTDRSNRRSDNLAFARFLADLLDRRFKIPGTRIQFGLDPLLGLIPGVGDTIANLTGSTILIIAARSNVPKIVLARMALNIGINTIIGAIPVLGDLFSIWFRSNVKNVRLLEQYLRSEREEAQTSDWLFVIGLLVGLLLILAVVVIVIAWLLKRVWETV